MRSRKLLWTVCLGGLPWSVVLLDFDSAAMAACGAYGYNPGCTESACLTLEISTNGGGAWQRDSVWIYGPSGASIDLCVRTVLALNVSQVAGWSLGCRHSAPTLNPGTNGGNLQLLSAAGGSGLLTVQTGSPPDLKSTRALSNGFTQGVAIDVDGTQKTIGPTSGIVVCQACYRFTIPSGYTVHQATFELKESKKTWGAQALQTLLPARGNHR